MNRQEFLGKLEFLLRNIPENERMDALAYYRDYFDEAGVENEQRVIQELGSPELVAQIIIEDVGRSGYGTSYEYEKTNTYSDSYTSYPDVKKRKLKTWQIVLLIVLLVITSPFLIALAAGIFGILMGILGGIFGILVGLFGAAFGLIVGGIGISFLGMVNMLQNAVEGMTGVGVGMIMVAIGILLALLFAYLAFVWLPKLVAWIAGWIKGLIYRKKGGYEI